ncbi:MAG: RHS repeat domain-containing protein [Candidatus Brocadiia bacterium]
MALDYLGDRIEDLQTVYDENGNRSRRGGGRRRPPADSPSKARARSHAKRNLIDDGWYHYDYDALNRLVRVSESDDPTVTLAEYSYDTNNRRITREVTHSDELNGTTRYVYDGWQVVEERGAGGSVEKTYTYGNYIDEPISLTTEEGTFYYHTNNLYNVRAITGESGEVVERYRYSAYGEPTILDNQGNERSASAVGNAYMFQGRRYDPESRLYYYRNRHYWPELGKFLQRDPIKRGQN